MQDREDMDTRVINHWNWIALFIPILGVFPLLVLEASWLWSKPHLQFFPLTMGIVAWVAYQESKLESRLVASWRFGFALFLVFFSMAISFAAMFLYSPWVAHVAVVTTFFAWGLVRFSKAPWTRVVAIGTLLISTVPLPLNWDQKLIGWLQSWSAKACGSGLDALHIPNFLQGNVIQIADHTLFVEEACSGVTSLYSLIALALIYSVLQRRSLAPSLLLLLVTPLVAINGNILRLLIIVLGFEWLSMDLTHGLPHDIVGISTFLASGVALMCSARILDLIIAPIPKLKSDKSIFRRAFNVLVGWPKLSLDSNDEDDVDEQAEMEHKIGNAEVFPIQLRIGGVPLWLAVFVPYLCILVPPSMVFLWAVTKSESSFSLGIEDQIAKKFPTVEALPKEFDNGWKRNGYNESTRELRSLIGQHSHTWRYTKGDKAFLVSLDFAFHGWHGLEQCYRNSGWTVGNVRMAETESSPWSWVECDMANELGIKGYLWYSLFDEFGRDFEMDVEGLGVDIRFARQTILDRFRGDGEREVPMTFQIQIFIESGPPLSDEEHEEIRALFVVIREQIRSSSMPAINSMKAQ